jgi:hypothetical protein
MTDTKQADVFIKDEGDFYTFGFQTEKGKEFARKNFPADWLHGDQVLKVDISSRSMIPFKQVMKIGKLTVEEC